MVFAPRCPACQALVVWEGNAFRPFCSERCRLIDLAAWVSERYRVPGEPAEIAAAGADAAGSDDAPAEPPHKPPGATS